MARGILLGNGINSRIKINGLAVGEYALVLRDSQLPKRTCILRDIVHIIILRCNIAQNEG